VKFAGIFQPVPEVQGGNAAFLDDLEVSVIVAPRDSVIHVLALRDDDKIGAHFQLEVSKEDINLRLYSSSKITLMADCSLMIRVRCLV